MKPALVERNVLLFFSIIMLIITTKWHIQAQTPKVSAIYGGGPFYYSASTAIPEIRNSGFTTAIVWTIHISANGDLNFNAEFPIVTNGNYVGTNEYPNFANDMALLKTIPTSVTRLEFGLSAWGSSTFQNIKDLIAAQGTGQNSILYRNFKALKDAIPVIDAVNFDDESTYDVNSSVEFAVMLADLGYKIALCPYTQSNYWKSVASQTNSQRPGSVDAVFLICYLGGSGNDPGSSTWDFGGLPVYPGLRDEDYTPSGVQSMMTTWKNQAGCTGGFIWLYDNFQQTDKTNQYAAAINNAFGIGAPEMATLVSPPDGGTDISDMAILQWNAGAYAQSHDVYFGTSDPPPFIGNQIEVHYDPGTLASGTTYYWRIDEQNFFGKTTSTVWSFTTEVVTSIGNTLPGKTGTGILQAYPNPFMNKTKIRITLPKQSNISASILNQYGQEVVCLTNRMLASGHTILSWQGENSLGQKVSSGVYILQVKAIDEEGMETVRICRILYNK